MVNGDMVYNMHQHLRWENC